MIVPAPVLTQVWRGSARQARLHLLLRGCRVDPTTERLAKIGGELLGRSSSSDPTDAIVVATALVHRATIVTGDPDDLRRIGAAAPTQPVLLVL